VVRAIHDVREELVGAPNSSEVFGDLGTLALDESNPVRPVAGTECPDVGE